MLIVVLAQNFPLDKGGGDNRAKYRQHRESFGNESKVNMKNDLKRLTNGSKKIRKDTDYAKSDWLFN